MNDLPPFAYATVYIVDDDEAVCRALTLALDLAGYRVESCRTGETLLRKDFPHACAFLLIDERLPGISGFETFTQLRRRGVDLPAALVTSHPGPALRQAAGAVGLPILEKPLLTETLIAAVEAGLAAPHG